MSPQGENGEGKTSRAMDLWRLSCRQVKFQRGPHLPIAQIRFAWFGVLEGTTPAWLHVSSKHRESYDGAHVAKQKVNRLKTTHKTKPKKLKLVFPCHCPLLRAFLQWLNPATETWLPRSCLAGRPKYAHTHIWVVSGMRGICTVCVCTITHWVQPGRQISDKMWCLTNQMRDNDGNTEAVIPWMFMSCTWTAAEDSTGRN